MGSKGAGNRYEGLIDFIIFKLREGLTSREIYEIAKKEFNYKSPWSTFRGYLTRVAQRYDVPRTNIPLKLNKEKIKERKEEPETKDYEKFLDVIMKGQIINLTEICNAINCSPKRVLELVEFYRSKGYEILVAADRIFLSTTEVSTVEKIKPLADKEIVFGVASDLHVGSIATQWTALNEFCNILKTYYGVKHVFIPGDVTAGHGVYTGQVFDLYAVSAKEQEDSVIRNLPEGFNWYALGGNHDYSFIKRGGGHNSLLAIASQREDFHYVGFDEADVPILTGVELKMWHPSGGVPYAISYRLQKGIEQITFSELQSIVRGAKEKPTTRFVLAGHLHIQMQALFGSVLGMQCGSFEGTTNYLKRKGLVPAVGGYVVEATLGKNGLLKDFRVKFYVFEEIEDDWKNYKHTIEHERIQKPLFNGG